MKKNKSVRIIVSILLITILAFQSIYTNAAKFAIEGSDKAALSEAGSEGFTMPSPTVHNTPVGYRFTMARDMIRTSPVFRTLSVYDKNVIKKCGSDYSLDNLYVGTTSKVIIQQKNPSSSKSDYELNLEKISKVDKNNYRTNESLILPSVSDDDLSGAILDWGRKNNYSNTIAAINLIYKAKNIKVNGKYKTISKLEDLGSCGALLVEPIWAFKNSNRTCALTTTELAVFFGEAYGYNTKFKNNTANDSGATLKFLSKKCGYQLPNALRSGKNTVNWFDAIKKGLTRNGINPKYDPNNKLWTAGETSATWDSTSNQITPNNVIKKGYGVGVIYDPGNTSTPVPADTTKNVYIRYATKPINGGGVNGTSTLSGFYSSLDNFNMSVVKRSSNNGYVQKRIKIDTSVSSGPQDEEIPNGLNDFNNLLSAWDYSRIVGGSEWQSYKSGSSSIVSFNQYTEYTGRQILTALGYNINTIPNNAVIYMYPNVVPTVLNIRYKLPVVSGFQHEYTNNSFKTNSSGYLTYASNGQDVVSSYTSINNNAYGLLDISSTGVIIPYHHYIAASSGRYWYYGSKSISQYQGFSGKTFFTDILSNETALNNKYKHEDVSIVVTARCANNTASIDLRLKDYDNISSDDLPELYTDSNKYIDGGYIREVTDDNGNYKDEPYYGKGLTYDKTITFDLLADKNGNRGLFKDQKSFEGKGSYYTTDSGIEISKGNTYTNLTVEDILAKYNTSLKTNDNVKVVVEISLEKACTITIQFDAMRSAESIEYENPSFKVVKEDNHNFVCNQDGTRYKQVISSNLSNYSLESPRIFGFSAKGYCLKNTYNCGDAEFQAETMDYLVELDLQKLKEKGVKDEEGNYTVTLELNWETLRSEYYDLAVRDIKLIKPDASEHTSSLVDEGDTVYLEADVNAKLYGANYQLASAKVWFTLNVAIGTDKNELRTISIPNCSVFITNKNENIYKVRFCTKSSVIDSTDTDIQYTKENYTFLIEELFPDGIDNNPYKSDGTINDSTNCNRFYIDASVVPSGADKNSANNNAKKYYYYCPKLASVQVVIMNKADNVGDNILGNSLNTEDNTIDIYSGQYVIAGMCVKANSAISTYYDIPNGEYFGIPEKIDPGYYVYPLNIGYTPLKGYMSYNDYSESYSQDNIESASQLRTQITLDSRFAGSKLLTWGTAPDPDNGPNKIIRRKFPLTNIKTLTGIDNFYYFNSELYYYNDSHVLNKNFIDSAKEKTYEDAKLNVNKINLKTDITLEGKKKTTGAWEKIGDNLEALDYSSFRVRNTFEATTGINYSDNQNWVSGAINKYVTKIATTLNAKISLDYSGVVLTQDRDNEYFSSEDEYDTDFSLVSSSADAHCMIPSDATLEDKIKNTYYSYKKEYLSQEFRINPYNNSEINLYSSVFLSNIDINDDSCKNQDAKTYTNNNKKTEFTSYENTLLQYETTSDSTRADNKAIKTIKINHKTLDIKAENNGSNVYRPGTDVITAFNIENNSKFDYTGYYDDLGNSKAELTLKGEIPTTDGYTEIIEPSSVPLSVSSNGTTMVWFKWHVPANAVVGSSIEFKLLLSESKIMDVSDEYKLGTVDVLIGSTKTSNTPDTTFTTTKNSNYTNKDDFDIGNIPYTNATQNDLSNVFFDNGPLTWTTMYWNHQHLQFEPIYYRLSCSVEKSNIINALKSSSNTLKSGYGFTTSYKPKLSLDTYTYDFNTQAVKNIDDIKDSAVINDGNFSWVNRYYSVYTDEQNVMCFFPEFNYQANTVDLYDPITSGGDEYEQYVSDNLSDKVYSGKSGFNNKNKFDYINNCAYGEFATLTKTENGSYIIPTNTSTLKNVHYIPIWYPDKEYKVKFAANEIWTPLGMVTLISDSNELSISGSSVDDWHFANQTYKQ